jgi:hypothetical protein
VAGGKGGTNHVQIDKVLLDEDLLSQAQRLRHGTGPGCHADRSRTAEQAMSQNVSTSPVGPLLFFSTSQSSLFFTGSNLA